MDILHHTPHIIDALQPKNLLTGNVVKQVLLKNLKDSFSIWVQHSIILHQLKKIFLFFVERPYISIPMFIFSTCLFTPVAIFVFLSFITSMVALSGFLITEGAILSVAATFLTVPLLITFGFIVVMGTLFATVYSSYRADDLVKNFRKF